MANTIEEDLAEIERGAASTNTIEQDLADIMQGQVEPAPDPNDPFANFDAYSAADSKRVLAQPRIDPQREYDTDPIGALGAGTQSGFVGGINTVPKVLGAMGGAFHGAGEDTLSGIWEGTKRGWTAPDKLGMQLPEVGRVSPEGANKINDFFFTLGNWAVPLGNKLQKADVAIGASAAILENIGSWLINGRFREEAELVGGLGASILSFFKGKPHAAQLEALEVLRHHSTESDELSEIVSKVERNIKDGETGSLGEVSGDTGIISVENKLSEANFTLKRTLDGITQKRTDNILNAAEGIAGGTTPRAISDAGEVAGQQQRVLQKSIEAQGQRTATGTDDALARAEEAEAAAMRNMDTGLEKSEASTEFAEALATGEKKYADKIEKPRWAAHDEGANIATAPILERVNKFTNDNLTPKQIEKLKKKFPDLYKQVFEMKGEMRPEDISDVSSAIKSALQDISGRGGNVGKEGRKLSIIGSELERVLKEVAPEYTKAVAATKKKHDIYQPKVLKKAMSGDSRIAANKMLQSGEEGAVTASEILAKGTGKKEAARKMVQYVKTVISKKGKVDKAFLENYDEFLKGFPSLHKELKQAKSLQDAAVVAKDTQGLAKATAKVEVAEATSVLGKTKLASFASKPERLHGILKSEDLKEITSLQKDMANIAGGTEALKKAVVKSIMDNIKKPKGRDSTVTLKSLADFKSMKPNLLESGIVSPEDVKKIEKLMDKAQIGTLSHTAQFKRLKKAETSMEDALSTGATVLALQMIPNTSNRLMIAGSFKRHFRKLFNKEGDFNRDTAIALEQIVSDPDKFISLFKDIPNLNAQHVVDKITRQIRMVSKASDYAEEDDKNE